MQLEEVQLTQELPLEAKLKPLEQATQLLVILQEAQLEGLQVMQAFPLELGTRGEVQLVQKLSLEQVMQLGILQRTHVF